MKMLAFRAIAQENEPEVQFWCFLADDGNSPDQIGMALFVVLYALDAFGLRQLRYRPLHQPA